MRIVLGPAVVALLASVGIAHAQENVRLTVVSGYAPTAGWVHVFENYFIPEVDKKLQETGNYRINWNKAWGTIAQPAGEFDAIENGLGDIGIVQTVFHPDKVPMYNMSYVTPYVASDIEVLTKVVNGIAGKYPAMGEVWAEYNQVLLTTLAGVDNYHLVLKDPIEDMHDLAGRKICGAGLNLRYLDGLGVVGVPSPLSDWYNNIRSGICDGTIAWAEAIDNYKLVEVAPNLVQVSFGGVNSMALTANSAKWDSLPEEVRDVLAEVSEGYRIALATRAMDIAQKSLANYDEAGGTIHVVSDAERAEWAASVPQIALEWVNDLESKGIPGKDILNDYLTAMSEAGQTPLRDWAN